MRFTLFLLLTLHPIYALTPVACAAGAPLGRFQLTASPPDSTTSLPLQSLNRLLPGYKISYQPEQLDPLTKKKARISLLLVPVASSRITVTEPRPADEPATWTVPDRTQIAGLVWGPSGLDKSKVTNLVKKNDELIGQLADYAEKIQQTQNLLAAITQDQMPDRVQNVDAAVSGFAATFPTAPKLDRNMPANEQLLTLFNGVNPALSAYDPLAQNPQQRAAQTAGLAAAVAGLFFGNTVGLAAGGGAVLVNMHSLLFPNTEFRSALAQPASAGGSAIGLCGNKVASASRTELAYLWAARIPDATAPEIALTKTEHLPIGVSSKLALEVTGLNDPKLAARIRNWRLVSDDGKTTLPVAATITPDAKNLDLDLNASKFEPGKWKLEAAWDWDVLPVKGDLELRHFSTFDTAHLNAESQDKLTAATSKQIVTLTGSDFEFVRKLSWKQVGDPFAQPSTLPFRLTPDARLETELDPKQMSPGNYAFLLAQADDKPHEVPFKILPANPEISNLPLHLNTGVDSQILELHGTSLDRLEKLSAEGIETSLHVESPTLARLTIHLSPNTVAGQRLTLHAAVKDVAAPLVLTDALVVGGPQALIRAVRKSIPGDLGIALQPDEIPTGAFVSFALDVSNAPAITAVNLLCAGSPARKIANGESGSGGRLRQESRDTLFLSFDPASAGQPGCAIQVQLITPDGVSDPRPLGTIVRLPKLDVFQMTDEKAGDASYIGLLQGQDLDTIEKVGWSAQTSVPVDAIPLPVAGEASKERLRIALPWPAPAPHAPLYIWLRGEATGRLTTAKY